MTAKTRTVEFTPYGSDDPWAAIGQWIGRYVDVCLERDELAAEVERLRAEIVHLREVGHVHDG